MCHQTRGTLPQLFYNPLRTFYPGSARHAQEIANTVNFLDTWLPKIEDAGCRERFKLGRVSETEDLVPAAAALDATFFVHLQCKPVEVAQVVGTGDLHIHMQCGFAAGEPHWSWLRPMLTDSGCMQTMRMSAHWFNMILAGDKKIEYRACTKFWKSRLEKSCVTRVHLINGYRANAPSATFQVESITVVSIADIPAGAIPEAGTKAYKDMFGTSTHAFAILLGKRLEGKALRI